METNEILEWAKKEGERVACGCTTQVSNALARAYKKGFDEGLLEQGQKVRSGNFLPISKDQYLLSCLAEECSEVIKEINKAFRFGLYDSHEKYDGTVFERIENELNDLQGVVAVLGDYGINFSIGEDKILQKKKKLHKYIECATSKGMVR